MTQAASQAGASAGTSMTLIEAVRLVLAHYQAGRLSEGEAVCRSILAALPEQVDTLHLLGVISHARGKDAVAVASMRRALALKPDFAEAYSNYGVLLQGGAQLAAAVAQQNRAIRLVPLSAYHLNRGSALMAQGLRDAAAQDFVRAAALKPEDPQPANSLGTVLRDQGRVGAALVAHRRALALKPDYADGWRDIGHVLRETGALVEARDAYAHAYRLDPARTEVLSYHLFIKQAICDWVDYDALVRRIGAIIDQDGGIVLPLATLSIDTSIQQQHRAALLFCDRVIRPSPSDGAAMRPALPARRPCERLNIAYFSADFHEHATAYLAAEMFELHDRDRFRVTAFSYGQDDGSPMRRRLTGAFDVFHDVRNVGLDQVARMVADQRVDILVDLKGYTKQSRLELLSRRLAPIEVAYLGYPGTVGAACMDYIIGDRFVTPPEHQPYYTERLVVMPDAYQINDRHRRVADETPSRAACGLPEDGFVFCAFNTTYKITPVMFGVWMRLLQQVPGSVLWLFEANRVVEENLRREASVRGIDPARLVFAPKKPLPEHLVRYRVADLCLDTLPYTGHTTTSDALWVGLPVVTCLGDTFASRVAASLLDAAGLPEMITGSLAEYEALALRLAREPAVLAGHRGRLAQTRMTVPLFDSRRFTRHLERAYETMWATHAAGRPPQGFVVPPLPPGTPD